MALKPNDHWCAYKETCKVSIIGEDKEMSEIQLDRDYVEVRSEVLFDIWQCYHENLNV